MRWVVWHSDRVNQFGAMSWVHLHVMLSHRKCDHFFFNLGEWQVHTCNLINNEKFGPSGKEGYTFEAKWQQCRQITAYRKHLSDTIFEYLIANVILLGSLTKFWLFQLSCKKQNLALLGQPSHVVTMGRGRMAAAPLQSSRVCPFTPWPASGPHVTWLAAGALRLNTWYK